MALIEFDLSPVKMIDIKNMIKKINSIILTKLLKLLFIGHNFEIIVFNYDVKLAFLFSLFHHLYPNKGKLKRCIFVTLLIDVSIFSIKNVHRYIFYYIFVRLQDKIITHTREEKFIYSESFKIRLKNKFIFIPYFGCYH